MRKNIMLCYPFTAERLAKWRPPYILQPKLDGERCRALIGSDGRATLLSSEENIIVSVPHINSALEDLHLRNVELDGELYVHGASFSEIESIVGRTKNIHQDSQYMEYHIFDVVNNDTQIVRCADLQDLIPKRMTGITVSSIQKVPVMIGYDLDDVMENMEAFIHDGYEGIIVREATAPYIRRRSTQVMKFKPRKEDIYEIIGYQQEVSIDNVLKDSLGSLLCRGNDNSTFSVGSGSLLTKDRRQTLWRDREHLVGRWARVKYQHLTSAQGVPRFPVIVEILEKPI